MSAGARLAAIRARAGAQAGATLVDGRTRLTHLFEHGGYRCKFPDPDGAHLDAVIVNTGGGVVAGDHVSFAFRSGSGATLAVSSTSAERVYRSTGPAAEIDVTLAAADGATLAWLPQPTILFSHARLQRRFEVAVEAGSRLVMAEAVVLGRIASGETMGDGLLHDVWRVHRDGRLVFVEATRLDGDIEALLARPAVAADARCMALMLVVAPEAEDRRDAVRAAVERVTATAGVSAWNGLLVARLLADGLEPLQSALRAAIGALRLAPLPAVWRN